jgi:hypothetical protein
MKIKKIQTKNFDELAKFLVKQSSHLRDYQFWRQHFDLFWNNNPYFKIDEHDRGWLITDMNDFIRGCLLNVPVLYKTKDYYLDGFTASTWYVDESYRGYSLELFSIFSNQKGVLWDTTPTLRVARIIEKKYKFVKLGKEKIFDVYVPLFGIKTLIFILFKIESKLTTTLNWNSNTYKGLCFSELNESQIKEVGDFALRYSNEPIIESHFLSEDIAWPYSKKNGFERICIYKNEMLIGIYFFKKNKYSLFTFVECFSYLQREDIGMKILKMIPIFAMKLGKYISFIRFRSIIDTNKPLLPISYTKELPNPVYCFEPCYEKKFHNTCLRNGDYSFF